MTKQTILPSFAMRLLIAFFAIGGLFAGSSFAQDFDAVERRLAAAVADGELSLEQAAAMMATLRNSAQSKNVQTRKQQFIALVHEIEKAVEAGRLTKSEAEAKIKLLQTKMFGDGEAKHEHNGEAKHEHDMEARKRRYMEIAEKIKQAVDSGKLSEKDAEKKLIELRTEMFKAADDGDSKLEARKRQYMQLEQKTKEAVLAGKLTKNEAEKKLTELRSKMFKAVDDGDSKLEARKRQYMQLEQKIKEAVLAGKLTKNDAEKKLIELRKKMFKSDNKK